ncbi:MAG: capsular biosynthesis protein [Leptolyngbya sp.]|nr:MAG: capsular biosynthesis protein [Leptolyngbya sp.]
MVNDNIDLPQDKELGYGQIFSVFKRRAGWIAGALAVSLIWAAYNSLQKESTYLSSMQLLIEPNYREQAGGARANTEGSLLIQNAPLEIDYATQIRVLQGSELLERAVELLRSDYPNITVEEIRNRLSVLRVTQLESASTNQPSETNIIQVNYTANDSDEAQRVVKILERVYLDYNLEQQELRLQNGLAFIDQQLPVVQQDVLSAERSLEQFRETQSLIDPETRASDLAASLTRVEQERQQVRAEFEELRARSAVLESQFKRTPQGPLISSRLSESTRYQNLLDSYQTTELEIAQQRAQFTEESSYMRRLNSQLESQRSLLSQEAERILSGSGIPVDQLFIEGQFGQTDLDVVRELGQLQASLSGLTARDQGLAEAERQIRSELARYPELIAQFTRLQPQIEIRRDTLQQLLRARQEISIDIARGGLNWQIIETAQPGTKTGPNLAGDLLLGSVAGLFLGLVLAFAREAVDNRLRTVDQIRQLTVIPVLGSIPYLPYKGEKKSPLGRFSSQADQVLTLQALSSPYFRNALDLVYKNIQLANPDTTTKSIAVTSALPYADTSILAIGLAATTSRLYKRVLLIDGNLRNPTFDQQLNLPNEKGLADFLDGQSQYPSIHSIKLIDCEIDVLLAGRKVSDPTRLLSSQTMKTMIVDFTSTYDLVIVNSPPVTGTVDALQLASVCQETILVARLNKLSQDDFSQALTSLYRSNLTGIVVYGDQKPSANGYELNDLNEEEILSLK